MATWGEIARQDPDAMMVVEVVAALVRAARAQPEEELRTGWDVLALQPPPRRGAAAVLGVGMLVPPADEPGTRWQPTLFMAGDEEGWSELGTMPVRLGVGAQPAGEEAWVRMVGLPRARALAAVGDPCDTPASRGTLGARVTTRSGRDGVLIAGHVADSVGVAVTDHGGNRLGTVVECLHPGQSPPQTASGDVAVVELDRRVAVGGLAHGRAPATVLPRDDLEIHGAATGVTRTWVRGISTFWAGPDPASGDWASVLVTRDGTTAQGDSGALVLRDGTLEPVGHVVGGVPGVYTLIQELDDQLLWAGQLALR